MTKQTDITLSSIATVLHTDSDPWKQPKGTHRYALNAVSRTVEGGKSSLSNENSFTKIGVFSPGFIPIGDVPLGNDLSFIITKNPSTGYEELGTLNKNDVFIPIVRTNALGLSISYQCDVRFRVRRGNERVIYWVDGLNRARTFNLDRIHNFYTLAYQQYLKSGGNPLAYTGEKWDASSFDLIKSYRSVPFFSDVKIVETGNILPGSYNFAIQYVDEDLNPTEWITTSNIVRIYNDTTTNPYERIRGSKNVDTVAQSFSRANKSIKLTLTNLDTDFPYYRMAIIRAAQTTGDPDKVLASEIQSTSDSYFTYTGNDSQLTEVALADILIGKEIMYAPQHIVQDENRLLLAHTKGKGINWCEFQKYASKIGSNLATKEVLLNNILSDANPKAAKSTFVYRGGMPGEVYSYGVCYLFDDGYISPAFHVPGPSSKSTTKLKVYEGDNRYLDIHNCSTDNYWGKDINGDNLVGNKFRFHRLPFRKDVNKPLVTTTTTTNTINKNRLKVNITLAVGKTYPADTSGNPLPINYIFDYKVTGTPSNTSISGIISSNDIGSDIYLYDDITGLDNVSGSVKGMLNTTSQMATTYMVTGNETFVIAFTYETYAASTSINDDRSEIFGIEFFNIEKPHPDVVGFYIVRNERTEDDKIIIDNAIFGSMTEYNQYRSFGLLTPKQYYSTDNCGRVGNSGKTLTYHKKATWFFNPEFQFFNKKSDFDKIEVEGVYSETSLDMPTLSTVQGSPCNGGSGHRDAGGSKGVYIDDVQAGTTYDPNVNKSKDKDDDGFDLIIGYKNTNFSYTINNSLVFPDKKLSLFLNAASYQNYNGNTYYNVSSDNKIGQYITDTDISSDLSTALHNTSNNKSGLIYGSLVKNNTSAYSNFINRPYYKEHNNPIYFGNQTIINGIKIFNGDAEIGAVNIVSSVFNDIVAADRSKKSGLWKIILGAVIVVAAVAAEILTGGAATPLVALAISYGVSLAVSGIKIEQFKSMIDVDYEKGLKETVTDGVVYECVRDTVSREDDTIRWFSDRISNIYIETSVPLALRSGLTSGVSDFIDAPSAYNEDSFRSYLTEKLTSIDRNQGSGRMYKGYASAEYYDVNKDYLRFNKEKQYSHLPLEYDCCADQNEVFPLRIWWSEQSFQEEQTDNYRSFLPNNYKDIEGEHGEITNLYKLGNNIFVETKEALWQIPQNNQERITGEITSFVGTGEYLSIPPRKILDDRLGSGGTQHKWATIKTELGVISVNEEQHKVRLHGDRYIDITDGNEKWFVDNLRPFLTDQLFKKFNVVYPYSNNPTNSLGVGYHSGYDTKFKRVLITKKDYAILQNKYDKLILIDKIPTKASTDFAYCLEDGRFYYGKLAIELSNSLFFEEKGWTISYSFPDKGFISYHSYLPSYYIGRQNGLFAYEIGTDNLWKFHKEGNVQTFFDRYYPHIIEFVSIQDAFNEKTLEDITFDTRARRWDSVTEEYKDEEDITYNKLIAYNTKQCTGEQIIRAKDLTVNSTNWMVQETTNRTGVLLASRSFKKWNINEIRDYVANYDIPLFTKEWNVIQYYYPIDKVVNPASVDFNKPWQELQVLRDKYAIIRLKFDNFNDVNLTFNYSLETNPTSE